MAYKTMQKRLFLFALTGIAGISGLLGQPDTLFDPAIHLEDLISGREEDAEALDLLPYFEPANSKKKLNLNTAGEAALRASGLFSDHQILHLLNYRDQAGPLLALYELQVIPGFDLPEIRQLLPYVTIGAELEDLHIPLKKLASVGRNDVFLRWKRQLEPRRGFIPDSSSSSSFSGDPNQLYLRFRHSYESRFSAGFTLEKDAGEEFFKGNNPRGFDFLSAHIFLKDYTSRLKALALGDYSVNLGQGLILNNGFGYGKGPASMNIKRSGRTLSPFTSINEAGFFRGGAASLAWGKHWETTLFISHRRKDANFVDSTGTVSAILLSGLHRTPAEIADEKNLWETVAGGQVKRTMPKGHLAINGVFLHLDKSLERTPHPYNRFYFNGKNLLNLSADYSWRLRNLHFFGETAFSQNGAFATVNGILAGLDRNVDLSLSVRHYPPRFQTLFGMPFAETGANNETGVYFGLEVRPAKPLRINAYFDCWKHPWLRFQADSPSTGHEWLLRLTVFRKRRWELYWQMRGESKPGNDPQSTGKTSILAEQSLFFSRWHFSFRIGKSLEWRTRIETGRFYVEGAPAPQKGLLFYQDLLFKPIGLPLSFTTRFGLFDTDGYDVRFYAYENGLLNNFAIPAYYDRGARFYFNARFKGIRNLTVELRYASSFFPGNQEIGTGMDATPGNRRSEVGVQIKYSF